MDAAIEVKNVSKCFTIAHNQPRSLQELLIQLASPRRRAEQEKFWALRGASFAIERGKTVGLIGTNGSGKSTALKLIAGILQPTSGSIAVQGRVSALLELGAGMHMDLTGRENVFLNGSLLGLSNAEMQRLYPQIVAFSELERFMDVPVKHYSSGMYMRLAFSVAIHVQPDVLLLDEVLAVGDQAFQTKCLDCIYQMKKAGVTIAIVSHSLEGLQDMCDELIWLKEGQVQAQGRAGTVAREYLLFLHANARRESESFTSEPVNPQQRWGSGEVELTQVRLRRGTAYTDVFLTGDPFTVEIHYQAHEPIRDPMFGLAIHHVDGTHVNGPNNKLAGADFDTIHGRGVVCYTIQALPLMAGSYELSVSAYDGQGLHAYDTHWRAYSFRVHPGGIHELYGMFYIPGGWEHHPQRAPLDLSQDSAAVAIALAWPEAT